MRKIVGLLVTILILVLCGVAAAELAAPGNVHWKEGSSATAAWDAVEGANYYTVFVNVYQNAILLGQKETGTGTTELDVQQEIYQIIGPSDYSYVNVSFSVCAELLSIDGDQQSAYSQESDLLYYKIQGAVQLPSPNGITFSDDFKVSFDPVDHVSWYRYQLRFSYQGKEYTTYETTIYTWQIDSLDISNDVRSSYESFGFKYEEVDVSFHVKAFSYDKSNPDYISSSYSEWTAPVKYKKDYETQQLPSPSNIVFSDDFKVSFDPVDHVSWYRYQLSFSYQGKEYTTYETTIYTWQIDSLDISNDVRSSYTSFGFTDEEVDVCFHVKSFSYDKSNPEYSSSDYSEWTAPVKYKKDYEVQQLPSPNNVTFSNDYRVSFDPVEHVSWYRYQLKFSYQGKEHITYETTIYTWQIDALDISNDVKSSYTSFGFTDEEVDVCFHVKSFSYDKSNPEYSSSDYSEWTAPVKYCSMIQVQSVMLSPRRPILFLGHSLYVGKTILPENAHYETIVWTSSDNEIASVNSMGKLVGNSIGTAEITATIGTALDTAEVTVYKIESNVEADTETQIVTDTAGTIIDDIGNNDEPDISKTDIPAGDIETLHNQILEGIERGDTFYIDWWWTQYGSGHFGPWWNQILNLLGRGQFVCGYDAGFEMYHEENDGTHHTIGNITEFKQEIEFSFDLPNLPAVKHGYRRVFSLARIHDNQVERIPVTVGDERWSAKSDRFSDFVLMYEDVESVDIDETNFPDGAFRSFVKASFDKDHDNVLSTDEIAGVKVINIDPETGGIASVKGIELFYNLEELVIGDCPTLTSLDVTKNTKLKHLECINCSVQMLDIRNCPSLCELVSDFEKQRYTGNGIDYYYYQNTDNTLRLFYDATITLVTEDTFLPAPTWSLSPANPTTTDWTNIILDQTYDKVRAYRYKDGEPLYGNSATTWSDTDRIGAFQYAPGNYRFVVDCEKNGIWTEEVEIEFIIGDTSVIIGSGSCGDNASWTLTRGGILTITGTGAVKGYFISPSGLRSIVKTVSISDGITSIGDGAFTACKNMESINIPEGITEIGDSTFFLCENLKHIDFPASLKKVGSDAFIFCSKLDSIGLPENVGTTTYIRCYQGSLRRITLPSTLEILGHGAFIATEVGEEIHISPDFEIPEMISNIDTSAFEGINAGIACISTRWDRSVQIGSRAFADCNKLRYFIFEGEEPESLTIAGDAFDGCSGDLIFMSGFINDSLNEEVEKYALDHGFQYIEDEKFWGNG